MQLESRGATAINGIWSRNLAQVRVFFKTIPVNGWWNLCCSRSSGIWQLKYGFYRDCNICANHETGNTTETQDVDPHNAKSNASLPKQSVNDGARLVRAGTGRVSGPGHDANTGRPNTIET